jgi:Phage integrase family
VGGPGTGAAGRFAGVRARRWRWAGLLIVTAGWTGARWGELLGLQRHNLHLEPNHGSGQARGRMVIDAERGALHEVNGQFSLGRPKTAHSARTVELPPFLVGLLARHLGTHTHPHVFLTRRGEYPRRSNFARRALRPAADGTLHKTRARLRWAPVATGLTFHGLRHSHATWLIADHIPAPAQARRLGHALPNPIDQVYGHIAPELRAYLLDCLQRRWDHAFDGVGGHVVGENGHRGRPDAVAAARRRAKARRATLRPQSESPAARAADHAISSGADSSLLLGVAGSETAPVTAMSGMALECRCPAHCNPPSPVASASRTLSAVARTGRPASRERGTQLGEKAPGDPSLTC